ncbi:calumenin [Anoplophora glabripennis]|uniref:calumenin n=1 Tax=Anoplophora glabripennis TaxID=217634 RepID=UPI000874F31B|nr:calumenin [Anoplophora glabripennis]XP_018572828.1 calumenin [Anoplophora glabripennis]
MIIRLVIALLVTTFGVALPKEETHNDRVFNRELSDKEHFENEHHNPEYDHEAFLGEEAKTFDQLPPEESKRRLGIIFDKIDTNNDSIISREELKDWIRFTQKRYISEDVDRQWRQQNPENNPTISWENYQKLVYGFLENMDPAESEKDNEGFSYRNMLKRDRRRWASADRDGDDNLTKEEFAGFLHPEETDYMRGMVIVETMEDIDKDKDGKISLQEYIGDMYRGDEPEEEPDWVKSEKEQFSTYRDKDGDGFMDEEEVKNWILPEDFDHAEAEARHLIYEADSDADEQLTKDEVLKKYDLFVGSQATDFGEALARHDEF